jgi:hypothetical protein
MSTGEHRDHLVSMLMAATGLTADTPIAPYLRRDCPLFFEIFEAYKVKASSAMALEGSTGPPGLAPLTAAGPPSASASSTDKAPPSSEGMAVAAEVSGDRALLHQMSAAPLDVIKVGPPFPPVEDPTKDTQTPERNIKLENMKISDGTTGGDTQTPERNTLQSKVPTHILCANFENHTHHRIRTRQQTINKEPFLGPPLSQISYCRDTASHNLTH